MDKRELLDLLENIDFDVWEFKWNNDVTNQFSNMNIKIITKENNDKTTIKINDYLSELKPMGIKITDQDGKVYIGEAVNKTEHKYECPECNSMHTYEEELTTVRCYSCDNIFQTDKSDDWKILDVNCLPSDWLVKGRYIFSTKLRDNPDDDNWTIGDLTTAKNMVGGLYSNNATYIYRDNITTKKSYEEFAPTHEEIMTKWWDFGKRGYLRVLHYDGDQYTTFDPLDSNFITWNKENFTGRKSMESES